MPTPNDRADVDGLKQILRSAWDRVHKKVKDERVYGFGFYTDEVGQSMFAFALGEKGLEKSAANYVALEDYPASESADNLRWSTGDSPYLFDSGKGDIYEFADRPDIQSLSETAIARETKYRLTAAVTALQELDTEGLFGTGAEREGLILYIEGGDVSDEWLNKWAKKLNPLTVFERFTRRSGDEEEPLGTFTEFGTKKIYETSAYVTSSDHRLLAAAASEHLFLFDTEQPKQLFIKQLPNRADAVSLGDVSMSADGQVIAVVPFGGGKDGKQVFILSGKKWETVCAGALKSPTVAVAIAPDAAWVAASDQSNLLSIFSAQGDLLTTRSDHTAWPRGLAVSADGSTLATADRTTVILWNTADWSRRHTLTLPIDRVAFGPADRFLIGTCVFEPNGARCFTATLMDPQTGKVVRDIGVAGYRIRIARVCPDGRYLVCAMEKDRGEEYSGVDTAALIDLKTGAVLDRLRADFEQIRDFAFLPHRKEIAVAVFGHTRRPLVLWKTDAYQP